MSNYKQFIPCIYLHHGKAVKSLRDDTVICEDPVSLSSQYSGSAADAILVFDLSDGDAEHDEAIEKIREICASVRIPVIGCGNIRRMEDVKKLIYAGCSMAALNYSKQSNIDLTKEVSEKFGKERIAACCTAADAIEENKELIEGYVQEMILLEESAIRSVLSFSGVSIIIHIPDISLDKMIELLRAECDQRHHRQCHQ